MKVYFIATYRDLDKKYGLTGCRVVGYYDKLDLAKQCIEKNLGDIYEDGYYKYAVIEAHKPGLYPYCARPLFYKWKDNGYKRIKRPKQLKGICNFTIG